MCECACVSVCVSASVCVCVCECVCQCCTVSEWWGSASASTVSEGGAQPVLVQYQRVGLSQC